PLATAPLLYRRPELRGQLGHALAVRIAHHRDNQAPFGVHRHADMIVLLQDELTALRIEAGVKAWELLEHRDHGPQYQDRQTQLSSVLLDLCGVPTTEHLQRGNIGYVLMHDVGNLRPGQTHLPRRGAPDALQRPLLDRTPATEIGQRGDLDFEWSAWPWCGFPLLRCLCWGGFLPGSRLCFPTGGWWHPLLSFTRKS